MTQTGVFDVRSYYNFLAGSFTDIFPWKSIWCVKVPKRVSFFLWIAARGGILTIEREVPSKLVLPMSCDGEFVDHLLVHSKFANALWREIFQVFGIQWLMPKRLVLFFLHVGIGLGSTIPLPGIWFQHV